MSMKKRVLSFVVEGQKIMKDEDCDFSGLVSGTKGYYTAKFSFDRDWQSYKKIAVFRNTETKKYIPIVNDECAIPDVITEKMSFWVAVIGRMDETSIPTTEVVVKLTKGGGYGGYS